MNSLCRTLKPGIESVRLICLTLGNKRFVRCRVRLCYVIFPPALSSILVHCQSTPHSAESADRLQFELKSAALTNGANNFIYF